MSMNVSKNRRLFFLLSATLLILSFCGKIVIERSFGYDYDQRKNYLYQFNSGNAKILELKLEDGKLNIQDLSDVFSTAFLEIDIKSNLKGFINEPEVLMIAGGDTLRQNLECRCRGIRYLNVSQLVRCGSEVIHFVFIGCRPENKSVRLIAYKNSEPAKKKILILSPHPDDAEISAYGLYSSNAKNCFIATITAGDAGSMRYDEVYADSAEQYIKKGRIRVWNSLTIPMLAGISRDNAINLGYFDASLIKMYDDRTSFVKSKCIDTYDINFFRSDNCSHLPDSIKPESSWRSLVTDIKFLILKVKPAIIISDYPALDYHKDHKLTTVALIQAMHEINYDSCELWLYTNHLPLTKMYPDGNIGSQISLPPYFQKVPVYFDELASYPLSSVLQADKTMALDAMNDLRPDTQYRNTKASWLQFKKNFFDKLYLKESDYFRRSVRSNELFFVVKGKNALNPEIQARIIGVL
jgi:LmbE family N-acetylglucosaminyl deacetylase